MPHYCQVFGRTIITCNLTYYYNNHSADFCSKLTKYTKMSTCHPTGFKYDKFIVYFEQFIFQITKQYDVSFDRFTPEQLGITASSALVWLCIELTVIIMSVYIMGISPQIKYLDLLALCGYKYVG